MFEVSQGYLGYMSAVTADRRKTANRKQKIRETFMFPPSDDKILSIREDVKKI